MKATHLRWLAVGALLCVVLAGALRLGANPAARLGHGQLGARVSAQGTARLDLPIVGRNYLDPSHRMSRFGVGVPPVGPTAVSLSALSSLNAGWYLDWTATPAPSRPGGVSFAQLVNLREDGTSALSGAALATAVRANPGALWLIGNEPDSPLQNNVTPDQYAQAYHELYRAIKAGDPTALVSAGGIVQPTPLRMRYLDRILEAYTTRYGTPMPVDVWNTHIYILREEKDSWGAYYPPGISDAEGKALGRLYEVEDHIDIAVFQEMVDRFRQWMAERGYQDCPLIITEFGVILPWDYFVEDPEDRAVADAKVLAFMDASIDYLLNRKDPTIGCPYDDDRLVQRWAWFALTGSWSGWLCEQDTGEVSVYGRRYAELAASQPKTVNLLPVDVWAEAGSGHGAHVGVPTRLQAKITNNGEVPTTVPVAVRFYEGDPSKGGVQIGDTQYITALDGGAALAIASVAWTPSEARAYDLYVQVDPLNAIAETNEGDNTLPARLEVTYPVGLPMIRAEAR
jgi:hypothetical protein